MNPINLNLTLVAYDTRDHAALMHAIRKTWAQIEVIETVVFTDKAEFFPGCKCVYHEPFQNIHETSAFDVCDLPGWILTNTSTSHTLHIQADGFVLNGKAWLDEWWGYDFIGAPWLFFNFGPGHINHSPNNDGRSGYGHVGNDGFSLRSRGFHERVSGLKIPREKAHPADWITSSAQSYMGGIKYGPWHVGMRFSAEDTPYQGNFGFHGQCTLHHVIEQGLYD